MICVFFSLFELHLYFSLILFPELFIRSKSRENKTLSDSVNQDSRECKASPRTICYAARKVSENKARQLIHYKIDISYEDYHGNKSYEDLLSPWLLLLLFFMSALATHIT